MLAKMSLQNQLQRMGVISELERVEDYATFEFTFKNGLYPTIYCIYVCAYVWPVCSKCVHMYGLYVASVCICMDCM